MVRMKKHLGTKQGGKDFSATSPDTASVTESVPDHEEDKGKKDRRRVRGQFAR